MVHVSPGPTRAISRRCGSSRNHAPFADTSAVATFCASMTRMAAVPASSFGAGVSVRGAAQASMNATTTSPVTRALRILRDAQSVIKPFQRDGDVIVGVRGRHEAGLERGRCQVYATIERGVKEP